MRPRVAVCLVGEPRGIKRCFPSLFKNVIDPLNASVFFSFNRAFNDDEEKIKLINKNLIFGELKEKTDLKKTLIPNSLYFKLTEEDFSPRSNWVGIVNGQKGGICHRHFDFKRMAEIISDKINFFDYFIITRSDFFYLFPIFDFSILNSEEIIKHEGFDNYSHTGMNWEFIICHKNKVLEFLNSPFLFMNCESLQDLIIKGIKHRPKNNESFQRIISDFYGWKISEMEINSFISADSLSEKTTWGEVEFCNQTNQFFKYRDMYNQALFNFEKYKKSFNWQKLKNQIKIL